MATQTSGRGSASPPHRRLAFFTRPRRRRLPQRAAADLQNRVGRDAKPRSDLAHALTRPQSGTDAGFQLRGYREAGQAVCPRPWPVLGQPGHVPGSSSARTRRTLILVNMNDFAAHTLGNLAQLKLLIARALILRRDAQVKNGPLCHETLPARCREAYHSCSIKKPLFATSFQMAKRSRFIGIES